MTQRNDDVAHGRGDPPQPTEPRDERLESLLDEALRPEAVDGGLPADLEHRVLAGTAPLLAARVVVRPWRLGAAVAALLALALGLGVWLADRPDPAGPIPLPPGRTAQAALEQEVNQALALMERAAAPEPIDQEIEALGLRIEGASSPWELDAMERAFSNLAIELNAGRGGYPVF